MDYKHHPDTAKSCKSIASNTHAIMCAVCGSKQYIKSCPRDHHHHIDPICMADPEWLHCADAFKKTCSRIEPLFSSPSLIKPVYANSALLQTPPNVFHSHSSVGVRMVPTSNPCLNKEKKDTTASTETIRNSESPLNQSRKKPRPGSRPKSRAGYENLEKSPRSNPQPHYATVPGEPNCCQVQCRPHLWQNCCPRLIPYPYQPLAYPVPQIIPVYVPVPHDFEASRNTSCETTSCQTEKDFNDENEEMNDYDFEKLAKELVMEQGFNSGDDNEEDTNLDLLVNKYESGMNVENIIGNDDKDINENHEVTNPSVKSQGDCSESKNVYSEGNDKDEWSSNDNYQEKEADEEEEKWSKKSSDKEPSDLSSCSGSHKYSKAGEEADVLTFTSYKQNIKSENDDVKNVKNTERPLSKEKASMTDFEENGIKPQETPATLNEYNYEEEKNQENSDSRPESLAESDNENNSKSQKSEASVSTKQEYDENIVIKKYENQDEDDFIINSQKGNLSDENNDSDEENSDEKYENTSENLMEAFGYKEPAPIHQEKKEGFKVINVYKKEVVTDDVKEDWLDTEEEFTPSRKESFENSKIRSAMRERVSDKNEPMMHFLHCKDSRREMIKVNQDEIEGSIKTKKRVEENDSHYSYKKLNLKDNYSPRMKSKIGISTHEHGNGEKIKSVSNKLIYTAIINKKEEKEKGEVSPFNSPRWREEVKKVTKRPEGKKRWMI